MTEKSQVERLKADIIQFRKYSGPFQTSPHEYDKAEDWLVGEFTLWKLEQARKQVEEISRKHNQAILHCVGDGSISIGKRMIAVAKILAEKDDDLMRVLFGEGK